MGLIEASVRPEISLLKDNYLERPIQLSDHVWIVGGENDHIFNATSLLISGSDPDGRQVSVLFDPGSREGDRYLRKNIRRLNNSIDSINAFFLTHPHRDHCDAISLWQQKGNTTPVFVSEDAVELLAYPDYYLTASFPYEKSSEPINAYGVKHGQQFMIGDIRVTSYKTPGHTPYDISYLIEDNKKILVIGDELWGCEDERIGSNSYLWKNSQNFISKLDFDIAVPGHPVTTGGIIKAMVIEEFNKFETHNTPGIAGTRNPWLA